MGECRRGRTRHGDLARRHVASRHLDGGGHFGRHLRRSAPGARGGRDRAPCSRLAMAMRDNRRLRGWQRRQRGKRRGSRDPRRSRGIRAGWNGRRIHCSGRGRSDRRTRGWSALGRREHHCSHYDDDHDRGTESGKVRRTEVTPWSGVARTLSTNEANGVTDEPHSRRVVDLAQPPLAERRHEVRFQHMCARQTGKSASLLHVGARSITRIAGSGAS